MKAEDERGGNGSRTNHARAKETTKNGASPSVLHMCVPLKSPQIKTRAA